MYAKAAYKTSNINKDLNNQIKKLDKQSFVITGSMPTYSRKELEIMIENAGGRITSSISSKTTFLVVGDKPGSKLQKAHQLGVKIITEKDLIKILSE